MVVHQFIRSLDTALAPGEFTRRKLAFKGRVSARNICAIGPSVFRGGPETADPGFTETAIMFQQARCPSALCAYESSGGSGDIPGPKFGVGPGLPLEQIQVFAVAYSLGFRAPSRSAETHCSN